MGEGVPLPGSLDVPPIFSGERPPPFPHWAVPLVCSHGFSRKCSAALKDRNRHEFLLIFALKYIYTINKGPLELRVLFSREKEFLNTIICKKRRNRFFTFDTAYCWKQHLKSWVKAPREKNNIQFSSISVIPSGETLLYLGEQSVEIFLHRQATLKNGHLNSLLRPRNYFEKKNIFLICPSIHDSWGRLWS